MLSAPGKSVSVLITSAGRRVALVNMFREALASLGVSGRVIAADMSRLSSALHAADEGVVVPACANDEFIPSLLSLCEDKDVGLLVPTTDTELPVLSAYRDYFTKIGTTVAVSGHDVVAIASDKVRTHEWLRSGNLPTVDQWRLGEQIDLDSPELPCIVKPRFGSASIGLRRVDTREELAFLAQDRTDYVVQRIAPGVEFTVDILARETGEIACAVPRRRLEVRAGEVSKAITVQAPDLIRLAHRVCGALPTPAFGPLNLQVFVDPHSGRQNVIELNPRFGGGYPLSWRAGADFPRWMVEWRLGLPSSLNPDGWKAGLVMLRYDDAVFVEAAAAGL